jgi:hypothetical protein
MLGKLLQIAASNSAADPELLLNGSPITSGTYVTYTTSSPHTLEATGAAITITAQLWGAAGGNGGYSGGNGSGAGGFYAGTLLLQPGTTYYLYVGQGGFGPSSPNYGNGGFGGWPNGGYGTLGDASGAGGGGMTMLSKALYSTGMSVNDILLIAGAGGGSTGYAGPAGAGGGQTGQNASAATGGGISSGGQYNGGYLIGGAATGSRTSGSDDGGGGGGGYYGGGGGTSDAHPGAGGSGYHNPSLVTLINRTTGSTISAPNPYGTLLGGYANGRYDIGGSVANGLNGLAYITF